MVTSVGAGRWLRSVGVGREIGGEGGGGVLGQWRTVAGSVVPAYLVMRLPPCLTLSFTNYSRTGHLFLM